MQNIIVVTSKVLSKEEVREFVESQGGYWNEEPTLDEGVIERGEAAVYVSGEIEIQPYDYDLPELEALGKILGNPPRSMVDLHISHAKGSFELAEDVARMMIDRWSGYLDYNDGNAKRWKPDFR